MCTGYTELLWRYLRGIYTWGNINISVCRNKIISEDGRRMSNHNFQTIDISDRTNIQVSIGNE